MQETIEPRQVQIRLVTLQETIERTLMERIHVKIGRQVKEKIIAQEDVTPTSPEAQDTLRSKDFPIPVTKQNEEYRDPVWFKSKVVSRSHAEIWLKDGQVFVINKVYLRDSGSSSGTFLNKMRLSPASRMSRPYPLREGDVIQLGVDYQGRTEVEMRVSIQYDEHLTQLQKEIPSRFKKALQQLLSATNPYSTHKDEQHDHSVDCCICISPIGPFQALFIAPCSHCYHYKCIQHILKETIMFPCPVCRQVANLEASVSMESISDPKNWKKSKSSLMISTEPCYTVNELVTPTSPQGMEVDE